jgi:hypothetical protein
MAGRLSRSRRAAAACALAAVAALAAGCASQADGPSVTAASPHRSASTPAAPRATPAASGSRPARASAAPTPVAAPPPPGRLHQTRAFPSARSRAFRGEMADLWTAVVTGRTRLALRSFFPLAAYAQVKAIYNPAADWHSRLFADYSLDIAAAHRLLGRGAAHTRLARVIVPSADAAWISPGVCENAVGYWHVGGARLVYRQHGRLRSFGIASLISWRGRWYVVHLGAVLRTGTRGIVDAPAAGPGVPGPAGGC